MHEHEVYENYSVCVVTVSTSRYMKYGSVNGIENIPEDDESGRLIVDAFKGKVRDYKLVSDDVKMIRKVLLNCDQDVVIFTGGTGLNPKDVTIEAVKPMLEREIEGFGEIFRLKSYQEIGYRAMLSRAIAGIFDGKAVFCLPGSKNAVKVGVEIIKETANHILSHARGMR